MFTHKLMALQSCKSPNFGNFGSGLPLGSFGPKCHLDVGLVASHKVYYKGEGGGFPQVRVVVNIVSPSLPMLSRTKDVGAYENVTKMVPLEFSKVFQMITWIELKTRSICNWHVTKTSFKIGDNAMISDENRVLPLWLVRGEDFFFSILVSLLIWCFGFKTSWFHGTSS
jgi:hypothetical protein